MDRNENNEEWVPLERPGYFGKHRDTLCASWDDLYGEDGWRISWRINGMMVPRQGMLMFYEDAYYHFLCDNPDTLDSLCREASDVYDNDPSNMEAGFDYFHQEGDRNHVEDITLRRVVFRQARHFEGREPLQIREVAGEHWLAPMLSPGTVPFHRPELIEMPELDGWWKHGTVESFYQSNKWLEAKKSVLDLLEAGHSPHELSV